MNAMTQSFENAKIQDVFGENFFFQTVRPLIGKQKYFKTGWSANLTAKTAKQLKAQGIL